MKTPKDFMPPRMSCLTNDEQMRFDSWYDYVLEPLFKNAVMMYSDHSPFDLDNDECADMSPGEFTTARFCFLAIGVRPLKQAVTKEELIKILRKVGNPGSYEINQLAERIEKWGVK